jgi:hypothetical protein
MPNIPESRQARFYKSLGLNTKGEKMFRHIFYCPICEIESSYESVQSVPDDLILVASCECGRKDQYFIKSEET